MPNATVRANARALPEKDDLWSHCDLDEADLSPEFAALHREFCAAVREEEVAIAALDGTPAAAARAASASDAAWEVLARIRDTEAVYVKDLRISSFPTMWAVRRHPERFVAESIALVAALDARNAGRLQ